jgi:cytochrome c oxidase subunit 1
MRSKRYGFALFKYAFVLVFLFGQCVMVSSLFVKYGTASGGWTMYPPLSALGDANQGSRLGTDLWLVAMALFVVSSLLGGLNYISTILNMRTKGMSMTRLPLTIWALFFTAILGVLSFPVLLSRFILLLFDRNLGTSFYLSDIFVSARQASISNEGGVPFCISTYSGSLVIRRYTLLSYHRWECFRSACSEFTQTHFWLHGHGGSLFAITILAFLVWAHHMFVTGLNPFLGSIFVLLTLADRCAVSYQVFNWLTTYGVEIFAYACYAFFSLDL